MDWLKKLFHLLASLKLAIPLLVILTAVTIVGSLYPTPDLFWSRLYLGLLGLLGLSLLLITILHAPKILQRKGRNALLGVITTHLGILVLIAGIIYGGFTGFRHEIKLIEGEVEILQDVPFLIRLDGLHIEEYREDDFPREDLASLPKKVQDSHITLLKGGQPWLQGIAAPGRPWRVDGITLLPAISDVGWYFELVVVDGLGRERTIPVRPWSPPLILAGETRLMTHSVVTGESPTADFFTIEDDVMKPLGTISKEQPLVIDGNTITLGPVKRYTAMQVYNRPQEPVLVAGMMFLGLVWHFYFRHRDRRREGKRDA
jgi:hypothetical protein